MYYHFMSIQNISKFIFVVAAVKRGVSEVDNQRVYVVVYVPLPAILGGVGCIYPGFVCVNQLVSCSSSSFSVGIMPNAKQQCSVSKPILPVVLCLPPAVPNMMHHLLKTFEMSKEFNMFRQFLPV